MATIVNKIGNSTFSFLRRNGERGNAPELPVMTKRIFTRPGLDGISVRLDGAKGVPFRVQAIRDAQNIAEAFALFDDYKDMEESGDPQTLIWNDVTYITTKYIVLSVSQPKYTKINGVAGPQSLATSPTYLVECVFELVAVAVEPEEEES